MFWHPQSITLQTKAEIPAFGKAPPWCTDLLSTKGGFSRSNNSRPAGSLNSGLHSGVCHRRRWAFQKRGFGPAMQQNATIPQGLQVQGSWAKAQDLTEGSFTATSNLREAPQEAEIIRPAGAPHRLKHMHTHAHTYTHTCIPTHAYGYICTHMYTCIYYILYVRIYTCARWYLCMHACIHPHVYIMSVCLYMHHAAMRRITLANGWDEHV